jgi:hypothetical protein
LAVTSPTLAEFERHAAKFGTAMVYETAASNGFTTEELKCLQLKLFEIERDQPKRRRRRGRR